MKHIRSNKMRYVYFWENMRYVFENNIFFSPQKKLSVIEVQNTCQLEELGFYDKLWSWCTKHGNCIYDVCRYYYYISI